jgi:hypothetical protein
MRRTLALILLVLTTGATALFAQSRTTSSWSSPARSSFTSRRVPSSRGRIAREGHEAIEAVRKGLTAHDCGAARRTWT